MATQPFSGDHVQAFGLTDRTGTQFVDLTDLVDFGGISQQANMVDASTQKYKNVNEVIGRVRTRITATGRGSVDLADSIGLAQEPASGALVTAALTVSGVELISNADIIPSRANDGIRFCYLALGLKEISESRATGILYNGFFSVEDFTISPDGTFNLSLALSVGNLNRRNYISAAN